MNCSVDLQLHFLVIELGVAFAAPFFMCCAARSAFAGRSGAERSEEIANGEGVTSGGATQI